MRDKVSLEDGRAVVEQGPHVRVGREDVGHYAGQPGGGVHFCNAGGGRAVVELVLADHFVDIPVEVEDCGAEVVEAGADLGPGGIVVCIRKTGVVLNCS